MSFFTAGHVLVTFILASGVNLFVGEEGKFKQEEASPSTNTSCAALPSMSTTRQELNAS